MSDVSSIKNSTFIASVGAGSGGGNAYSTDNQPQQRERKPSKLRIGEIVRATIIERIDDEYAYVRIPTGTFIASVGPNLKNSDSLLFKVSETNPNLILKIHEVPTGNQTSIFTNEELLRVLDLPKNEFYLKLIDCFKKYKTSILRDDMLQIYKVYKQYSELNRNDIPIEQFANLVVELNIGKLPLSINLISKLLPLYVDENIISDSLNYIAKNINELPNDIKIKLDLILDDIRNNKYSKNNIFVLAINENEQTFFEILNEIDERNDVSKNFKHKSNILRDLIASLSLWNILSFSGKTPLQYFIPYLYQDHYFIIRIVKRNFTNQKLDALSFYFSVPTDNMGEVKNKMIAFQNQLKLFMSNENNKFIESLDSFKEKLVSSLESRNYNLEFLKLSVDDISKELNQITSTAENSSGFTIVV